jgi:hypothetical protein
MLIVFQWWQSVLLEWERCNILDEFGDVPTHLPKPIAKSTFGCLVNSKEKNSKSWPRGCFQKQ